MFFVASSVGGCVFTYFVLSIASRYVRLHAVLSSASRCRSWSLIECYIVALSSLLYVVWMLVFGGSIFVNMNCDGMIDCTCLYASLVVGHVYWFSAAVGLVVVCKSCFYKPELDKFYLFYSRILNYSNRM